MSIWTDKDGRKHVGLMVNGKRVHRILPKGASASDAKQLERDLGTALEKSKPLIPRDPPIALIMPLYYDHAKTLRSPSTAKHHADRILPWLKQKRCSEAEEVVASIVKDLGPVYKPATLNRSIGAITKALTLAWKSDVIAENYGLKIERLPENNKREVFLTVDQVKELADATSEQVRTAIWTALLTGARRGEICKIEAAHIGADTITIPKANTKTFQSRTVPIVPALRPHLKHLPLQIDYEGVKSGFRRAREAVGLPHVHFHDLRHSCASILISLGVDLYTVSKILGHSSIASTERYAHLQVGQQRKALNKLSSLVKKAK
jgi:integrase